MSSYVPAIPNGKLKGWPNSCHDRNLCEQNGTHAADAADVRTRPAAGPSSTVL